MTGKTGAAGKASFKSRIARQKTLHIIMIPLAIWAVVLFYIPILGNIIAFEDYSIPKGFIKSTWVGLKHFKSFFSSVTAMTVIRNTLAMSIMALVFGTVAAVIFALLLNEILNAAFKRVVQTVSYLPYFISMAVCANLSVSILGRTGPANQLLMSLGLIKEGIPFLESEGLYWSILTVQSVWKSVGWNAILYLAAIAGISFETYEAAYVDGAGRFRVMWNVTLPAMLPTIAILLVMNSGGLIAGNFEQQYLMFNPMVMDVAEVISTYVYKRGIGAMEFSFATAVGIFQSAVSFVILILVNKTSKKLANISLW